MKFEVLEAEDQAAVIKVIGVGGCGGNAVDHMIQNGVEGVEFICANTDAQALKRNQARTLLQLGTNITKGLGAGANPDIGRAAGMEDHERISELIEGADMLFITAGMGGGTGTGAAPVVAEIAKEMGILTVAVVTKPFLFEGTRLKSAESGMKELSNHVDSLIVIPNDKLMAVLGDDVTMDDAFKAANNVLYGAVAGIAEVINCPGLINVDFADVKTVMSEKGTAMMGTGTASGPDRARIAAEHAVASKLLEDISLQDAKGVLVNITAGPELSLGEIKAVGDCISDFASEEAIIVTGTVLDDTRGNDLIVTVIATGLSSSLQTISKPSGQVNMLNDRKPLPLSDAARKMLENPPKVEKIKEKSKDEEDYLDIPSFVRTQLD